eukprot:638122-Amphidinium_carterae.1
MLPSLSRNLCNIVPRALCSQNPRKERRRLVVLSIVMALYSFICQCVSVTDQVEIEWSSHNA